MKNITKFNATFTLKYDLKFKYVIINVGKNLEGIVRVGNKNS